MKKLFSLLLVMSLLLCGCGKASAPETVPATEVPVTEAPTTEAPKADEGGCSGFVALGVIAAIIPAAAVICSKKKED